MLPTPVRWGVRGRIGWCVSEWGGCSGSVPLSLSLLADDLVDHSGVTPGHFAAYYGHLACLQILWAQGVDLLAKDKFSHTPADWARSAKQVLCLNYLTTVETCCNLMEENSELQQQVFE